MIEMRRRRKITGVFCAPPTKLRLVRAHGTGSFILLTVFTSCSLSACISAKLSLSRRPFVKEIDLSRKENRMQSRPVHRYLTRRNMQRNSSKTSEDYIYFHEFATTASQPQNFSKNLRFLALVAHP